MSIRVKACLTLAAAVALSLVSTGLGVPTAASSKHLVNVSLRLDYLAAGSQAPFFLALERGYYKSEGLNVNILDGQGSSVTVQQVGSGANTFGWASMPAFAEGTASGIPVKSVAMITSKSTYAVFVPKSSSIHGLSGLYGKTVLVAEGTADLSIFKAMLTLNHIDTSRINITTLGEGVLERDYVAGQGDALVGQVPYGQPAIAARPSRELLFAKYGFNLQDYGLIAQNSYIQSHPKIVKEFVAGSVKGWAAAKNAYAAAEALKKYRPQADVSAAKQQDALYRQFIFSKATRGQPIGCASPSDWKTGLKILKETHDLTGNIKNLGRFFTNQFVPGCHIHA